MKKRYPGPLPFSYEDNNIFFGREQEIEYLSTLILNNRTTVLHGKSGFGKSSLINAGLIPYMVKNVDCEIIRVRFYNYDKAHFLSPRDTFLKTIQIQHSPATPYIDKLVGNGHVSAWRYFKKMQSESPKTMNDDDVAIGSGVSYILIFDQFEELFTYPKEYVKELAKELQEVIFNRIPEEYQDTLKESFRNKENLKEYQEELNLLDKDIPVKVVFSLRSDRFNYLTHLIHYIPNLLKNTYKVTRMAPPQVKEAIIKPTLLQNGFGSPRFILEDGLVNKIIDFLSAAREEGSRKKIEIFEMQIICQKLEEIVIQYDKDNESGPRPIPLVLTEKIMTDSGFIKDKKHPFSEIIKNYYKETVSLIASPAELLSARYLIERKLIDQSTGNRISLDMAFVDQTGISEETLRHLINRRMVRIESNTVSGSSIEISHDSLILPIMQASAELGSLDRKLAGFFDASVQTGGKKTERMARKVIYSIISSEHGTLEIMPSEWDEDFLKTLRSNPVVIERKPAGDRSVFAVKEIFQQTAQQEKERSQRFYTKNWIMKFVMSIFVSVIVIFLLLRTGNQIIRQSNRNYALVYLGYAVAAIEIKEEAIRVADYIYDQKKVYPEDSAKVKTVFLQIFQSQYMQSRLSTFTDTLLTTSLSAKRIDISPDGNYFVLQNDREGVDSGHYKILDNKGNDIRDFERINYAYFTNYPNTVLLAKYASASSGEALSSLQKTLSNEFILFDCSTGSMDSVNLGRGNFLYPLDNIARPYEGNTYDSYRVQFTASGRLLVPFSRLYDYGPGNKQVRLIQNGRTLKNLPSIWSTSLSKDGKKILVAEGTVNGSPGIAVYDEDGHRRPFAFRNVVFADFTEKGDLIFGGGHTLKIMRDDGVVQEFNINDYIKYAYADGDGRFAVVKGERNVYTVNTENGAMNAYRGELVDVNFDKQVFITSNNIPGGENEMQHPDTLWKRHFLNDRDRHFFSWSKGIRNAQYNKSTDELMVLTRDNQLLLLNGNMAVKAGFLLTANDISAFSRDGKTLFYVRDEFLTVFKNDGKLINFFDFDTDHRWLHNSLHSKPLTPQELKDHDLSFTKEIF